MSSILTNTSAMVALQTMKGINKGLQQVQSEISTGKSVASARDNAAVWAISKVMESDVQGFESISSSLDLGSTTVGVARKASETVTDLLNQIKGKIVGAQEANVDKVKIQDDIKALTKQIESVVGAAQFNGLNLVDGSQTVNLEVLSSLDRSGGDVKASKISVDLTNANLSLTAGTELTAGDGTLSATSVTNTTPVTLNGFVLQGGAGALAKTDPAADPNLATGLLAGDRLEMKLGDFSASYTVREGDTADSLVTGLKNSLQSNGMSADFSLEITAAGELTITNNTNVAADVSISGSRGSGGLSGLNDLDVTSDAAGALGAVEDMIQTAITASASFGSAQKRIDIQADFVSSLTDSLKAGIGSMVDADMEEASARLQALQVQQQLGVQALSIANQSPQSVLSLFR
jgi:flagellin